MSTGKDKIREALESLKGEIAEDGNMWDVTKENLNGRIDAILAELDRMEAPKVLTTEALWQAFKNELVPDGRSESIGLMFDQPTAEFVLRYVRDNGYLATAAGLTVEEAMEVFSRFSGEHVSMLHMDFLLDSEDELRARLTAALTAKSRTA